MITSFPFGSASAQATALRRGQIGSVDPLKTYLARVDRSNPALNALVVDDPRVPFKRARAADHARAAKIEGPCTAYG